MTTVEWRRVDVDGTATRYESTTNERALLVAAEEVNVVGTVDDDVMVAFVEPPTAAVAGSLLEVLGDEFAVVALPPGAGGSLVTAGGQVRTADGVLDLYRLPDRSQLTPRPPADPVRPAEDESSLEGRAAWFRRRSGPAE